jgi:Icc-related predicted phosphoesterase
VRINVVSDVHGAVDDLARSGDGVDAVICLGDLILFLDYADLSRGIFGEIFGEEGATEYVRLRTARRFQEAGAFSRRLWAEASANTGLDRQELMMSKVREQYAALFAVLPTPSYLTYGNVDVPAFWPDYLRPGQQVLDGQTVEIDGLRFGFVGGGLISPMRTPYELTEAEFDARIGALGDVDVLCSHIPPQVPSLTYDVVAKRFEVGSSRLLEYIQDVQPLAALFGHVHQPAASRLRIGRTECQNVGHFRAGGAPFTLTW